MNRSFAFVAVLLVTTSAIGAAVGAGATVPTAADGESSTTAETRAGAHVAFAVESDAIVDYEVGGEKTFSSVAVRSQREADAGVGVGTDVELEAMSDLDGAGLSIAAESRTSAEVRAESGATLSVHDNERGTLVVQSGGESQYVEAELAAGAEATGEGDRVRVETDSHEGVFLVVGDGEVTVTDDGDVAAALADDATLVFRAYQDGDRGASAEYEESLIADGKAAAEVYVETRGNETIADAVTYGEETSAQVSTTARNEVEMTVERTVHDGTVVLTTVSEEAVGSAESIEVTVDGEAAVEADSKSELEGAIGGDRSAFTVAQHARAQGEATVYVAINHFSERTATISGDGGGSGAGDDSTDDADSDGSDGTGDTETADDDTAEGEDTAEDDAEASHEDGGSDDGQNGDGDESGRGEDDDGEAVDNLPGFGASVAVIALSIVGLLARIGG